MTSLEFLIGQQMTCRLQHYRTHNPTLLSFQVYYRAVTQKGPKKARRVLREVGCALRLSHPQEKTGWLHQALSSCRGEGPHHAGARHTAAVPGRGPLGSSTAAHYKIELGRRGFGGHFSLRHGRSCSSGPRDCQNCRKRRWVSLGT